MGLLNAVLESRGIITALVPPLCVAGSLSQFLLASIDVLSASRLAESEDRQKRGRREVSRETERDRRHDG